MTVRAEYCGDSKEPRESCPEAPSSSLGVGRRVPWAFPLHPLTPLTAKAKSQAWPPPTANAPGRPLLQGACTVTALLHPYLGPSQPTGGSQGRWGGLRGNKLPVSSSSPPTPTPGPLGSWRHTGRCWHFSLFLSCLSAWGAPHSHLWSPRLLYPDSALMPSFPGLCTASSSLSSSRP